MHDVWIHMHVFIIAIPIELRKYLKSIYLLQGAFSKINIVWVCILKMILWNLMVCNMQPWDEVMHLIMFFSCNLTRNELASMVSNFAPQAGMQEAFSKINSQHNDLHCKKWYFYMGLLWRQILAFATCNPIVCVFQSCIHNHYCPAVC